MGFKYDSACRQLVPAADQPLGQRGGDEWFAALFLQCFRQLRGRAGERFALADKFREKNNELILRLRLRGDTVREQISDMRFAVKLQRQLPVFDIPPGAIERRGAAAALVLAENKIGVRRAADSRGTRDHIHGIVIVHLPQVVDEQDGDAVPVRQLLENAEVTVVAGVGIYVVRNTADALERVDGNERGAGMIREKTLDLLLKTAAELFQHGGEEQIVRCVVRDIQQPVLDAGVTVLQTEVEHITPCDWELPHGFAFGNTEAEPQRQPRFSYLRRARQNVQSLRQQPADGEPDRRQRRGHQGFAVYGVQPVSVCRRFFDCCHS